MGFGSSLYLTFTLFLIQVVAFPQCFYADDRDAAYKSYDMQFGCREIRNVIWQGVVEPSLAKNKNALFSPRPLSGLEAATPVNGWSHVRCPGKQCID